MRPILPRKYPETVAAGSAVDEVATRPPGSAPGKAQRHRRRCVVAELRGSRLELSNVKFES